MVPRRASSYAGNGYGSFFVPEVGDEVLVAFVQGDMRYPIILGGLYNGEDKPPTRAPTSRTRSSSARRASTSPARRFT